MSEALSLSHSPNELELLDDLPTKRPNTLLSGVLWSVAGLAVGLGVIFIDYFSSEWNSQLAQDFLRSPAGQFWLFLIVVQTVYWAAVAKPQYTSLRALAKYFKGDAVAIILWCVLFAMLIFAARIFAPSCGLKIDQATGVKLGYGLPHSGIKLTVHTIIGAAVALMAGAGSLLVRVGFKTLLPSTAAPSMKIKRFLSLRSCLLYFLTIAGLMLGLVTLAQTAKRSAVMYTVCDPPFDRERVLIFGLYYTGIVVLAFAPTFTAMFNAGRKLRDDILPMPSPEDDNWPTWYEKRQKLEQLLEFSNSQGARAILTFAAPLIGSAFSLLTPH
jgi:hypothetical protein